MSMSPRVPAVTPFLAPSATDEFASEVAQVAQGRLRSEAGRTRRHSIRTTAPATEGDG